MKHAVIALALLWTSPAALALAQPAPHPAGGAEAARAGDATAPATPAAQAQELFERGNQLRDQGLIAGAMELYRQALALYDHPYINYNLALTLRSLGKPVEAYTHLRAALDSTALAPEVRQQGAAYAAELRARLAELAVVCKEPGARVSVDGRALFHAPGTSTVLLEPGTHAVAAETSARLSASKQLSLEPGESRTVELILPTLERRWQPWLPWTVMGAGALAVLVGVPLELSAHAAEDQFHAAIAQECTPSCADGIPAPAEDIAAGGRLRDRVAIGAFAAGGITVFAGAIMLYLNQPRLVSARAGATAITPVITPDSAGIRVRF